jgi:hypothetical protein
MFGIIVHDREGDTFVVPVVEVGRAVAMDPDLSRVARFAFDFMLAEPVINTVMKQHPAAMGVDVRTVIVQPKMGGFETAVWFRHILYP